MSKISNLFSSKKTTNLKQAIEAQKHVGIMDIHSSTGDFVSNFKTLSFAELPVNPSIEHSVTFFRAHGRAAEDQAAYFEAVHDDVALDAVILITGSCSNNGEHELAAAVKERMADIPIIMAWPLFNLNKALGLEFSDKTHEDLIDKARGYDATLIATPDKATFTSECLFDDNATIEESETNIILPPNIDILLASTDEREAVMAYMELSERNPYAPTDPKELSSWKMDFIQAYREMPNIKAAIEILNDRDYSRNFDM